LKSVRLVDLARSLRPDGLLDGLVCCYGDRWGGVSSAPYSSLNLGFSTGDDADAVRENRRRFTAAAGLTLDDVVVAGQVHGSAVARVDRQHRGEGAREPSTLLADRDVVILSEPQVFALALAADCPLVAIADPRSRHAGVAHCGWRGIVAGALGQLLEQLDPGPEALAMISPAISAANYPVGPEVHEALEGLAGAASVRCGQGVDLRQILRNQLIEAGISQLRIAVDPRCTAADGDLFSYRRDRGCTGRGGLLLGWKY